MQDLLQDWLKHRDTYLDELLRADGQRLEEDEDCICSMCHQRDGNLRCLDCSHADLLCRNCTLQSHTRLPLHRVEVCVPFLFEFPG